MAHALRLRTLQIQDRAHRPRTSPRSIPDCIVRLRSGQVGSGSGSPTNYDAVWCALTASSHRLTLSPGFATVARSHLHRLLRPGLTSTHCNVACTCATECEQNKPKFIKTRCSALAYMIIMDMDEVTWTKNTSFNSLLCPIAPTVSSSAIEMSSLDEPCSELEMNLKEARRCP